MTTKRAADLEVGERILVSKITPDSDDVFERMDIQFDPNGYPVTVSDVYPRALIGPGMMLQVDKGVFRDAVMPDDIATLAD